MELNAEETWYIYFFASRLEGGRNNRGKKKKINGFSEVGGEKVWTFSGWFGVYRDQHGKKKTLLLFSILSERRGSVRGAETICFCLEIFPRCWHFCPELHSRSWADFKTQFQKKIGVCLWQQQDTPSQFHWFQITTSCQRSSAKTDALPSKLSLIFSKAIYWGNGNKL